MSLLTKAKSVKRAYTPYRKKKSVTEESIELSLAWLSGEVSIVQCQEAIGATSLVQVYVLFARGLRAAHDEGILKIV